MSGIPMRAFRREVCVYDSGDTHWRGARLMSTTGATSTLKVWKIGGQLVGTAAIATSLLPADGRSIGQPLAVRLDPADLTTVVEVIGSTWPAGDAPNNEVAAAAGTGTHVGCVPRSVTNESEILWEG